MFVYVSSAIFFATYAWANVLKNPGMDNGSSFKEVAIDVNYLLAYCLYLAYAIFYGSRLSDKEA